MVDSVMPGRRDAGPWCVTVSGSLLSGGPAGRARARFRLTGRIGLADRVLGSSGGIWRGMAGNLRRVQPARAAMPRPGLEGGRGLSCAHVHSERAARVEAAATRSEERRV